MTVGSTASAGSGRPIELHYWPTPNGRKITIALEEMGLPYTVRYVDINKGEQHRPEFLAISPNNRMPAIVDPDGPDGSPVSIFESGAILQYLGRKTGQLYPADERARIEVEQWLYWQVGGLGPMSGQANHFRLYAPEKIPYGIERYTAEVARLYGVMERRLAGRDHLAGDFSIADIACFPWVALWKIQGQDISAFPRLGAWLERIGQRAGVERGMAVGRVASDRVSPSEPSEAEKLLRARSGS
jgi:GST-like protein